MDNQKFTIIMPTRGITNLNSDNETYFSLVMKNYHRFLDVNSLHEMIIISPRSAMETLQSETTYCNLDTFPLRFIAEEDILPQKLHHTMGWFKQQLIKILMCQYIQTKIYLIVDDDLFLIKKMTLSDLIIIEDGQTYYKYSSEKCTDLGQKNYSSTEWWQGSAKLLQMEVNFPSPQCYHLMSVTPQIFVVTYVSDLITTLQNIYSESNDQWMEKFIEFKATEFSLYWIYLHINNLYYMYSDITNRPLWSNNPLYNILDQCTMEEAEVIIENGFQHSPDFFIVIQSYLKYPFECVKKIQDKFLG